jgi:hypothetical protein
MPRRRGRAHDDLFAIFPDLPRLRPRPVGDRTSRLRRALIDTRARAAANIERQRAASAAVRVRLLERQPRMLALSRLPLVRRRRS